MKKRYVVKLTQAERPGFSRRTVEQIRERCVTEGLDSAL